MRSPYRRWESLPSSLHLFLTMVAVAVSIVVVLARGVDLGYNRSGGWIAVAAVAAFLAMIVAWGAAGLIRIAVWRHLARSPAAPGWRRGECGAVMTALA